ncbi:hypothetical protein D3C86_1882320 [compost metagenome]
MGHAHCHVADAIKPQHLLSAQPHLQRPQRRIQLLSGPRTQNRNQRGGRTPGLFPQPGNGHMGRAGFQFRGDGQQGVEQGGFPGAFLGVNQHAEFGRAVVTIVAAVLAGEEAATQGRP